MKPEDIEKQSFAIIEKELSPRTFPPGIGDIVKRVIHTTADFSFADSLCFSDGAVEAGVAAMQAGCTIVTDTQMAKAGLNAAALARLSCRAVCYMADPAVAAEAKRRQCTRAAVSMEKARTLSGARPLRARQRADGAFDAVRGDRGRPLPPRSSWACRSDSSMRPRARSA